MNSNPIAFEIPPDYLYLFAILRSLEIQGIETTGHLLSLPPLNVIIKYMDIGDEQHKSEFFIHLNADRINISAENQERIVNFISGTINAIGNKNVKKQMIYKTLHNGFAVTDMPSNSK
jgi:hypothetical protein